jgi:hypothetical protein
VKLYLEAANQNNYQAQINLGLCYEKGLGVKKNMQEAGRWYKKAADQGSLWGIKNLANISLTSTDSPNSKIKAIQLYKQAADLGDAESQRIIGMSMLEGSYGLQQDYDSGYKLIQSSADKGDEGAKAALGFCYFWGAGVKQDYDKAYRIFSSHAERENMIALAGLGYCYMLGRGAQQDARKAFRLIKKSAESGDMNAAWNLGILYLKGQGVEKDAQEGFKWMEKSGEFASASDQRSLGYDYEYSEDEFPQDLTKAFYWYEKSANRGLCCGMYSLGTCYIEGKGTKKNIKKGMELMKQAKNKGCEYASEYLDQVATSKNLRPSSDDQPASLKTK